MTAARDEAVAKGITVNGLPIMLKAPGPWDIEDLDLYYRDASSAGRAPSWCRCASAASSCSGQDQILLEVAGHPAVEPLVKPAQQSAGRAASAAWPAARMRNRWGN